MAPLRRLSRAALSLLPLCALAALGCSSQRAAEPAAAEPSATTAAAAAPQTDTLPTSAGELQITPVHHGTLRLALGDTVIWIDPWSEGDLRGPKGDFVFITDIHPDHYDAAGLGAVKKPGAVVVAPPIVAEKVPGATVMENGKTRQFATFAATAVPMYNLERGPSEGRLYHDKGRGNGYLFTFGDKKVYVSGDTECTEEMRALEGVDVAFVSMNLPYTMPPEEAAECIKAFSPEIVYPYHYRGSDLGVLRAALAGRPDIELRERSWY